MTSKVERAAADYVPKDGAQRALVTPQEVIGIPASWIGKYVWFHNAGDADVFLNFSEFDSITIDETTVTVRAASTPFALTLSQTPPKVIIPAGTAVSFRLDDVWRFFAHKSSGTGMLHFGLGQGPALPLV